MGSQMVGHLQMKKGNYQNMQEVVSSSCQLSGHERERLLGRLQLRCQNEARNSRTT